MSEHNRVDPCDSNTSNSDNSLVPGSFASPFSIPSNSNISVEFVRFKQIIRPDGTVVNIAYTNPNRVACTFCNQPLHDQAMLAEHKREFTQPRKLCEKPKIFCPVGHEGYAKSPYCDYACVEHGFCYNTGEEAQAHARDSYYGHTKCFYPRCENAIAKGNWNKNSILDHVQNDHHGGMRGAGAG